MECVISGICKNQLIYEHFCGILFLLERRYLMKRKVFMVGALCLLLMFTLVGCGKHGDTELTVSSDVMDDKVTLSVTDSHSNYTLSKS